MGLSRVGGIVGLFVVVIVTLATTTSARADDAAVAPEATKLFGWIVGRWSVPEDRTPDLSWSMPDGLPRPTKRRASDPAPEPRVELIVTEEGDVLDGALDAVTPKGHRTSLATFTIERGKPDCPLTWREGGATYKSPIEGSGSYYRVQPGDVARSDQKRYVRFTNMRSRTRRSRFPIIVEFRDYNGFSLRRVQGPQHGKAVDQMFALVPVEPRD